MSNCVKKCVGEGVWLPILVLASSRGGTLNAALSDVQLCEMHKDFAKLDDFLSPEGWDKIQKHLRENGKGTFLKRRTALEWQRASGTPEPLPF